MHGAPAETVALALLVLTLIVAVVRPFGAGEALAALPAAAVVVLTGIVGWDEAARRIGQIGPAVGFLAAVLVLGRLCADEGVFAYLGSLTARAGWRRRSRLLALVVALAAAVTVVLTLDATIVLLTPAVLATAGRLRIGAQPYAYACLRLANSASLLLPVSNLTNLLAFHAATMSFARFASLMVLPWLVVCAAEWLGLRVGFRRALRAGRGARRPDPLPPPRYALLVLAASVAGIVAAGSLGVSPAWPALAGCVALLARRVRRGPVRAWSLLRAASPGFCIFVLALAVVVQAVSRHGLGGLLEHAVPSGSALSRLLLLALLAALLANLVNNLPATLILVPLAVGNPAAVLAVLIGVNIGPNATYPGSLATLLWRRLVPAGQRPTARTFHLVGALTSAPLVVLATVALWAGLRLSG